ncbi:MULTISPECIES: hypothetical protein [unclassified Streptomyces]|uniref:hypothetical protein n=1 Tax=unclassified Streptomyces TaxID=2593676 RepID=UPI0013140365|nr:MULTISPECIES: hypothetical protein [unclassified Streptomyces]WUC92375.1 hypothetical protein OG710_01590 [Streptomyces sp. NBC_00525]
MRSAWARRAADAVRAAGTGAVLLAYWTTVALLARGCGPARTSGAESVRRKA